MSDFSIKNNPLINPFKESTEKEQNTYLLKQMAPTDTFEKKSDIDSVKKRGKFNQFIDRILKYSTGCTDGNDDGKLSFKEKAASFNRGILNMFTNFVDSLIEHPVVAIGTTLLTVCAGALLVGAGIVSMPVLAIAGSAIGLGFGTYNIAKGVINANKADNDTDAKYAYEHMGEGTATVALSSITMAKGVKNFKEFNAVIKETAGYAKQAQSSAARAQENLSLSKDAVKSIDKPHQLAGDAESIHKEILKLSQDSSDSTLEVQRAKDALKRIKNLDKKTFKLTKKASASLEETQKLAQEADKCASEARTALISAKKSKSISNAIKNKEIAQRAAERAAVCADGTDENLKIITSCLTETENKLPHFKTEVSNLEKIMIEMDKKISGFDYNSVSYAVDERSFGLDISCGDERTMMRADMEMNAGLCDDKLQVKTLNVPANTSVHQLPKGCKYEALGIPEMIDPATNKPYYACPNAQLVADGNGVRGKIILVGAKGKLDAVLELAKKANIRTVIDLRAEGTCSERALMKLNELEIKYLNFPIDHCRWNSDSLMKITEYIKAINSGDYFVGCANGESRTDLGMMINYLFNPEAKKLPVLVFGTKSTTRGTLSQNMSKLLNIINGNPEIVKDWGWGSYAEFIEEYSLRYQKLFTSIGLKK